MVQQCSQCRRPRIDPWSGNDSPRATTKRSCLMQLTPSPAKQIYFALKKKMREGIPWWSSSKDSVLSLPWAWVQSPGWRTKISQVLCPGQKKTGDGGRPYSSTEKIAHMYFHTHPPRCQAHITLPPRARLPTFPSPGSEALSTAPQPPVCGRILACPPASTVELAACALVLQGVFFTFPWTTDVHLS